MLKIPTFQNLSSKFRQDLILGGRTVILELTWNSRAEAWYLYFEDFDSGDILYSTRIVPNFLLLRQYRASIPLFDGDLLVYKTDEEVANEISYENFGNGWDLMYLDEPEAEAWEDTYGLG
jgi:hypothetical protein